MNVYLLADFEELGGGVGLLLARGGDEEHSEARERGQQARRRHGAKSVAAQKAETECLVFTF
jgi:hypothetical protein